MKVMDWIDLAMHKSPPPVPNRDRWRALVHAVMNILVP